MGGSEKPRSLWPPPSPTMKKTPLGMDIHKVYDPKLNQWVVDKILNVRSRKLKFEYLVSWKGYSREDASWEPDEHISNCREKVTEFWVFGENKLGTKGCGLKPHKNSKDVPLIVYSFE